MEPRTVPVHRKTRSLAAALALSSGKLGGKSPAGPHGPVSALPAAPCQHRYSGPISQTGGREVPGPRVSRS